MLISGIFLGAVNSNEFSYLCSSLKIHICSYLKYPGQGLPILKQLLFYSLLHISWKKPPYLFQGLFKKLNPIINQSLWVTFHIIRVWELMKTIRQQFNLELLFDWFVTNTRSLGVSWKFSHCYFLCDFLMQYAVIINYFGKKNFQSRENRGKQLF